LKISQAVLSTLAYHDIFNYPLTLSEIHSYLIDKKSGQKSLEKTLELLVKNKRIGNDQSFFFLKGKKSLVNLRIQRQHHSQKKLEKAKFYAQILRLIPSVRLVAVSGALAMGNSHKNDDIDLVIISAKGLLWTTRFFTNILLWQFKRDPKGKNRTDRACLNLFLDESALKIHDQNLYTAHEIVQLKTLLDNDKTYSRLIKSNSWLFTFLPNWKPEEQGPALSSTQGWSLFHLFQRFLLSNVRPFETILKNLQLLYMKSKITTEKIGDRQLFFHPKETQRQILMKYETRVRSQKIFKT